jgi:molybdopterin molybdotransferase
MITPDDALQKIKNAVRVLQTETVPLSRAVDRVLAEDLFARIDLPPFPNSAMDGYAVRTEDLKSVSHQKPVKLLVKTILRAGETPLETLNFGEAARIMTGARLPSGADAVIMREVVEESDSSVIVFDKPAAGDCLRLQGEDVLRGERLLSRGCRLRPYDISLMAAQGLNDIPVIKKPKTALLITGDELVPSAESRRDGKIWDSNGPALAAALSRRGIEIVSQKIVPDDAGSLLRALREIDLSADLILVSGGVSMGDFDYTRSVLSDAGFQEIFWKVAIKPGQPLLFAVKEAEKRRPLLFGLPGNPLSALVCLEEFVFPALDLMEGREPAFPAYHLRGETVNEFSKAPQKQQFLFCRAVPGPAGFRLTILKPQRSDLVAHACGANALAVAPLGVGQINAGDTLAFRWLL